MNLPTSVLSTSLLFASILLPPIALAQPEADSSWFETTTNWNQPGASIPQAPAADGGNNLPNCQLDIRAAKVPEDALVEAAGWTLTGPVQMHGATTVITGMTDADGMCRPLNYQMFVFTEGKFSGTLSPTSMNSRTDGSLTRYDLYREGYINATFSRYTPEDPLCCPSRQSNLFYEVEMQNEHPVLVPKLPATTSTPDN